MIIISAILIIKRLIAIYITIFNIYFQYVFNLVNNQQNKITKIEIYIILLEVQGPMGPSFYLLQRALGGPSLGGPIDPHLASEVRTNMAKKLFLMQFLTSSKNAKQNPKPVVERFLLIDF